MMLALILLLWRNILLRKKLDETAWALKDANNMLRSYIEAPYEDQANPGLEPEGMGANVPEVAPGRESQNSRPKSLAPSTPPDFMKPRPSITEILHDQDREESLKEIIPPASSDNESERFREIMESFE